MLSPLAGSFTSGPSTPVLTEPSHFFGLINQTIWQVGEALAGAGAPGPAAQALARQAGMFLDQRWPRLAATLLPRLASCHRSLSQVGHTA